MNFRARAWTFTINNDTDTDLDSLLDMNFRYLCFGFEVAPKSGTPHIQGYIYLHNGMTKKALSKLMPRAFLEASKGTSKENAVYTSKVDGDDWYEFGDRPMQGEAAWQLIEDVMKDPRSNPHLYNQYSKMYRQLKNSEVKSHTRKLKLIPYEKRYWYTKKYNDSILITDIFSDTVTVYDGEDVVIMEHDISSVIEPWINDCPPKFRRGYELIRFDPRKLYLCFKSMKEFRIFYKKYELYIDVCKQAKITKEA